MNVWLCGAPCGARVRNPCAVGGRPVGLLLRAVRPDICKPCANAAGLTKRQNFAPFCLHGAEGGDKMGGFRPKGGDFRREMPTFVRKSGGRGEPNLCLGAVFSGSGRGVVACEEVACPIQHAVEGGVCLNRRLGSSRDARME